MVASLFSVSLFLSKSMKLIISSIAETITNSDYQNKLQDSQCSVERKATGNHRRTIIHIDIDCFYAQVEMINSPILRTKPLGIKQKNIVVTCNYVAREAGVKKTSWIKDALKICPDLVLVNGEDLHRYRQFSENIFSILQSYKCPVEKLGMDENFMDVTKLVCSKVENLKYHEEPAICRHSFNSNSEALCNCGCNIRLKIGSHLANEIREKLYSELEITSSAGISFNKVLSKLIGGYHKPNDQTVLFPCDVSDFMLTLKDVRCIPSIGSKLSKLLHAEGIHSVKDLQNVTLDKLRSICDPSLAKRIYELSHGIDTSEVKKTGKPLSIGLEDRFMKISEKSECFDKLKWLLKRLAILVHEDGRVPQVIKVTVRDFYKDKEIRKFHKESRQCKIDQQLFQSLKNSADLEKDTEHKILQVMMGLLSKMVNFDEYFHLTLIGISVTDFLTDKLEKNIIETYFKPGIVTNKPELQKQNQDGKTADHRKLVRNTFQRKSKQSAVKKQNFFKYVEPEKRKISCSPGEPSSKFSKLCEYQNIDYNILQELPEAMQNEILANFDNYSRKNSDNKTNKLAFSTQTIVGFPSPSGAPHNSSKAHNSSSPVKENANNKIDDSCTNTNICSSDCSAKAWDEDVFKELPKNIQDELLEASQSTNSGRTSVRSSSSTRKSKSIFNYFKKSF